VYSDYTLQAKHAKKKVPEDEKFTTENKKGI
jgi:hypothetical protein